MKLKTSIELTFLGVVIMAAIAAIFSISVATHQMLTRDDFAYPQKPFGQIDDAHELRKQRPSILNQQTLLIDDEEAARAYGKAQQILKSTRGFEDQVRAHDLLMQVVQSSHPNRAVAAYELGKIYRLALTEGCQEAAFEWFITSANWGYRKAHLEIGKSYKRGIGIDPDFDQAVKHYQIASHNGSAAGALELIELLLNGGAGHSGDKFAAQDAFKTYLPLLEGAAKNGNGRAARSIARLYQSGELVKSDLKVAQSWFEYATEAGDAPAMHDLALIKLDNNRNSDEAIALLKQSAQKGYSAAMTALGRYYMGQPDQETKQSAIRWFEQGVSAGHAGAMEELAHLYFEGKIVEKDIDKARNYATRGSQQKHKGAIKILQKIESNTSNKIASKE